MVSECELGLAGTGFVGRPHPSVRATTLDDLTGLARQLAAVERSLWILIGRDTNETCEGPICSFRLNNPIPAGEFLNADGEEWRR